MSGSFEPEMECMQVCTRPRLTGKSFGGMESEPMLIPRGKNPLLERFSSAQDQTTMLQQAGQ